MSAFSIGNEYVLIGLCLVVIVRGVVASWARLPLDLLLLIYRRQEVITSNV